MTPSASVITQALERNNLSLEHIANSVFGSGARDFITFVKNPNNSTLNIKYKDLSKIASKLQIPFGYLFLEKLPQENIKIPELRRKNLDLPISNALKESVKNSEYKQLWYRDYLISVGEKENFTQKYNNKNDIVESIKNLVLFESLPKDPYKAMQKLIDRLQNNNFLIFIASSIDRKKGTKIEIEDCRGYCLYDSYTPIIFLNNADSYRGKIFTILHELAHILCGENGITTNDNQHSKIEKFCNEIASEILIPKKFILEKWDKNLKINENAEFIEKECLASKEAIATKAINLKIISKKDYDEYREYLTNLPKKKFFARNDKHKTPRRIIKENSANFARAIVTQTLNNNLDFNTAMDYLGIKEMKHFDNIRKELKI